MGLSLTLIPQAAFKALLKGSWFPLRRYSRRWVFLRFEKLDFLCTSTCSDRSCLGPLDSRENGPADLCRQLFQRTPETASGVVVDSSRGRIHLFWHLFLHGNTVISEKHFSVDVREAAAASGALVSGLGRTDRVLLVRAERLVRDFSLGPKWAAMRLCKTWAKFEVDAT